MGSLAAPLIKVIGSLFFQSYLASRPPTREYAYWWVGLTSDMRVKGLSGSSEASTSRTETDGL